MSKDNSKLHRFKLNDSSSFNKLNRLSIYNNDNSYSSMTDIKNNKSLHTQPMGHSFTTENDKNNTKKYNKHNGLKINTLKNDFKEKNWLNIKHYNKVSEVTLQDRPFSEILFNEKNLIDDRDDQQTSPTSQTNQYAYLYGTAKDHGFGTKNDSKDTSKDDRYKEIDDKEVQPYAPFEKTNFSESTRSLALSKNNSLQITKLESTTKKDAVSSLNKYNSQSSNNLNMKISQNYKLINPIKELLLKQFNSEIEISFNELEFYNDYKDLDDEEKVNDNFYKIENIINDDYINKRILLFLNELDNSEREFIKQQTKIKELKKWKAQTGNKIKQIENTIRQMYQKQINENLNEYHVMKDIMEKRFNEKVSKNEVMTNNYNKIINKYDNLINVKLPNLERWNESIAKMKTHENKNKVTIINCYDLSLIFILIIIYFYYFYP
ncbi:uncharacterized protein HGUI_03666 [Hanseniaspora guilliermondii]|uniref:Uncharacterized protein n=1 Tax=Hanseniaspora guilliermondii TaxID=56406 RepID=A0A1L0CS95_9ASCO|nr:uncharacterized protein HGUI_03666 [Hanseniaspora guilliermondii]